MDAYGSADDGGQCISVRTEYVRWIGTQWWYRHRFSATELWRRICGRFTFGLRTWFDTDWIGHSTNVGMEWTWQLWAWRWSKCVRIVIGPIVCAGDDSNEFLIRFFVLLICSYDATVVNLPGKCILSATGAGFCYVVVSTETWPHIVDSRLFLLAYA